MKKETNTTTEIIALEETAELKRFDELSKQSFENMKEMCQLAYKIAGDDKEKRRLFIEHIQDLGYSRTTGVQMLNAGKLYNNDNRLLALTKSNVVELVPVADENGVISTEFYEETNTDPELLGKMSQSKIRGIVNWYLTEDEETEDEATEDEATEVESEKTERPAILDTWCDIMQGAIDCLEMIDTRYKDDLEKEDLSFIHDTLYSLRRAVVSNED